MNQIIKNIALTLLFAGVLCSCGTITHTSRQTTFAPDRVELRLNSSDLKYLGKSEITIAYSTYLGFISVIDSINGLPYNSSNVKKTYIEGINRGLLALDTRLSKALYKVVEDYPEATYFQVVYNKKETDRMFLGSEVKQTVLVKAYSFFE